jgi:site-specific recombinase XerD
MGTLKVTAWLYRSKATTVDQAPLYYRLALNNQRIKLSSGKLIDPVMWNDKTGRAISKYKGAAQVNKQIELDIQKLNQIYLQSRETGKEVSINNIKLEFQGRGSNNRSLLSVVDYHNNLVKTEINKSYAYNTYKNYFFLNEKLIAYIKYLKQSESFPIKNVDYQFITEFESFLKVEHNNKQNTAAKYLVMLKKITNLALDMEWITENPFRRVKTKLDTPARTYLTKQEVILLETIEIAKKTLLVTRDCCLLQIYTGAAYIDLVHLSTKNIVLGIDGQKWIVYNRTKTKVKASLPILPQVQAIIDKYEHHPCRQKGILLPFISNQKMNKGIKKLMFQCNIHKNITSHSLRRTFATTIAMGNGVSIETISKILGHTTTKVTHQYAVVTDTKISEEMEKLRKSK